MSVLGIGNYYPGKYVAKEGNKHTKEYALWRSMLVRCYKEELNFNVTYKDCSVAEEWKDFQVFAEWCNSQFNFRFPGMFLDKDILVKGNKEYSPNTCCFVPRDVNNLFTDRKRFRGDCPIGVHLHPYNNNYVCRFTKGGKGQYVGSFSNPKDAFLAYKSAKESWIKEVADKNKLVIIPEAYSALYNYEVNIED